MSETKHTPLPWRWEFLPEDHGYETLIGTGGFRVLMHSGEYGPVKEEDKGLIITSVNARPKVEELVGEILQFVVPSDGYIIEPKLSEWKCLVQKAKEVKAALGGKAE